MKKLEKQFLSALKRAVKELGEDEIGYLMDVCDTPYSQLKVKTSPRIRFTGSETIYVVRINMAVKTGSKLNAVLMEIAHKLYIMSVDEENNDDDVLLSKFLNGTVTPEINMFWFPGEIAYSWDSRGSATFFIEQECGCSWLLFPEEEKDAEVSYVHVYPDKLIRKEAY